MSAHIEVRFTPSPESAEASFGRDVPVRLALHETADGAITIDIRIIFINDAVVIRIGQPVFFTDAAGGITAATRDGKNQADQEYR